VNIDVTSGDQLLIDAAGDASDSKDGGTTGSSVPGQGEGPDGTNPDQQEARSNTTGESDDEPDPSVFLEEPPDLDFDDVGGMSELKETLVEKVVDPLERPELYEEYDLGVVNGVLLYGPPGTGKTYITRALAGKLGYNFVEVSPSDLTSSLVGEASDNVADLFDVARDNQPCLVFVDEIDAIAADRSGGAQKSQSERQMVNQFLTEMNDVQGEDVVVFAATNLLESVDDAIKRSGRFDERIEVPPPDGSARVAILRVHLRNRPVLTESIDWETIEDLTEGYSASDVELVAANAARQALQEARESGDIQPVSQSHLESAVAETESSLTDWHG
jgi:transitional endoplasmic reticulum ATPase